MFAVTLARRQAQSATAAQIKKVGVIGLGLMGHGIAQATALAPNQKYQVTAIEANSDAVDAGRKKIEASVSKLLAKSVTKGQLSQASVY